MLGHCGRSGDFTVHGHVTDTLKWADKTGAVFGVMRNKAETGMEMRKHRVGNRDALSTTLTTSEADAWVLPTLPRPVQEQSPAAVPGSLVQPEVLGHPLHFRG